MTESNTSSLSPALEALSHFGLERIVCSAYAPVHQANTGCHTSIPLERVPFHVTQHGGGFKVTLKEGTCEGWKALELELLDMRCGTCGELVQPNPQAIAAHLQPHLDRNRRMSNLREIWITLGV